MGRRDGRLGGSPHTPPEGASRWNTGEGRGKPRPDIPWRPEGTSFAHGGATSLSQHQSREGGGGGVQRPLRHRDTRIGSILRRGRREMRESGIRRSGGPWCAWIPDMPVPGDEDQSQGRPMGRRAGRALPLPEGGAEGDQEQDLRWLPGLRQDLSRA